MIINVSGYGSTGASAYIDLLKEFEGIQFLPDSMEFQILQEPDGILDLEYALLNGSRTGVQVAIARFMRNEANRCIRLDKVSGNKFRTLKSEYISKIGDVSWQGKSIYDPSDLKGWNEKPCFRKINRLIDHLLIKTNKYGTWPKAKERHISNITHQEFVELTQSFITDLLKTCGLDTNGNIVLEQLYNTGTPLRGAHLMPSESKSLIIDRDPRDVFIITNHIFPYYNRYMPHSGDVESFVKFYKATHRSKDESSDNVFYLQYEDTIYEYEHTIEVLKGITGGAEHINRGKLFVPENSINNTQLYNKGYEMYSEQIKFIEDELTEYLYPFETKKVNISASDCKPFERQTDLKN